MYAATDVAIGIKSLFDSSIASGPAPEILAPPPSIITGFFDFSITNSTVLAFVACNLAVIFYNFACYNAKLIPTTAQTLFE